MYVVLFHICRKENKGIIIYIIVLHLISSHLRAYFHSHFTPSPSPSPSYICPFFSTASASHPQAHAKYLCGEGPLFSCHDRSATVLLIQMRSLRVCLFSSFWFVVAICLTFEASSEPPSIHRLPRSPAKPTQPKPRSNQLTKLLIGVLPVLHRYLVLYMLIYVLRYTHAPTHY
jgi:hypothetical protein